jgi:2-oxo-4-hydroxy-4-carboxy-5-ureidoimidazoline decarboxylase
MSDKYFTFLSKRIGSKKFVNILKSIYEHSPWVPERLLSKEGIEIKTKRELHLQMKQIVDNASKIEKLNLIRAHPELGNKLQKTKKLTRFSQEEQKSVGLDQCTEEEFEILTSLNKEYRSKFEFPFIIAVKGLSKNYIIENMKKRIKNNQEEEFNTAISEVHKIAKLRINDLTY